MLAPGTPACSAHLRGAHNPQIIYSSAQSAQECGNYRPIRQSGPCTAAFMIAFSLWTVPIFGGVLLIAFSAFPGFFPRCRRI